MARIRSIHPGLFTDEAYMALGFPARELIKGLWCEADDNGVFEWKPLTLKARIMPADNIDMHALLAELVENRFVVEYEVEGKRYGAIRNFRRYQRPKKPSEVHPLPNEFRTYVGLSAVSSEPVGNQFGTGGEKSPQMEEGGGRREEKDVETERPQPESVTPREPRSTAEPKPAAADAAERKREINRIMDIGVRLCAVAGIDHEDPRWHGDFGCIARWLASGADPDLDIVPAAEAVMAKRRRTDPKFVPKSLAYFREAVEEARQRRTSPAATSGGSSAAPQRDRDGEFRVWMQFWREKRRWLGEGPSPDEPGCIVPDRIRNETLEGAA